MERRLRKQALEIFKAALKAADPVEAVLRHVHLRDGVLISGGRRYRLANYRNIYVVGAGKATAAMARAVERLLGRRITAGFLNVKYGHTAGLRRVEQHDREIAVLFDQVGRLLEPPPPPPRNPIGFVPSTDDE